jgi:hypothetical protein
MTPLIAPDAPTIGAAESDWPRSAAAAANLQIK